MCVLHARDEGDIRPCYSILLGELQVRRESDLLELMASLGEYKIAVYVHMNDEAVIIRDRC